MKTSRITAVCRTTAAAAAVRMRMLPRLTVATCDLHIDADEMEILRSYSSKSKLTWSMDACARDGRVEAGPG